MVIINALDVGLTINVYLWSRLVKSLIRFVAWARWSQIPVGPIWPGLLSSCQPGLVTYSVTRKILTAKKGGRL